MMKMGLLVIGGLIVLLNLGHTKAEPGKVKNSISTTVADTTQFKTNIQPILLQHCSPCHFPGGKMYVSMPFDKGETIIVHAEKALRRFSDEKEKALIKQFVENNKIQ